MEVQQVSIKTLSVSHWRKWRIIGLEPYTPYAELTHSQHWNKMSACNCSAQVLWPGTARFARRGARTERFQLLAAI